MKSITEYTPTEYMDTMHAYLAMYEKIQGYGHRVLFDNLQRHWGYAHYNFSGRVSDKLIELLGRMPTPNEIIMIIDSGFSHFGATCTITGRNFSGRVHTD